MTYIHRRNGEIGRCKSIRGLIVQRLCRNQHIAIQFFRVCRKRAQVASLRPEKRGALLWALSVKGR